MASTHLHFDEDSHEYVITVKLPPAQGTRPLRHYRKHASFTEEELQHLEAVFAVNRCPPVTVIEDLALQLNAPTSQVQVRLNLNEVVQLSKQIFVLPICIFCALWDSKFNSEFAQDSGQLERRLIR